MTWKLQNVPYPQDLETLKVGKLLPKAHRVSTKGVSHITYHCG
ncbi:hypothetical protein [Subsaximicrobium wynnwilliamsii]|nr:hypothetical protein [Subsaximicrobium wynnwilliamsii]